MLSIKTFAKGSSAPGCGSRTQMTDLGVVSEKPRKTGRMVEIAGSSGHQSEEGNRQPDGATSHRSITTRGNGLEDSHMPNTVTGGCACGAVRYEYSADPVFMGNCHCRDCQRTTGGAYVAGIGVPESTLKITGIVP